MGFFSNGCGNHHWGEWTDFGGVDVRKDDRRGRHFAVLQQQKRGCLHDCDASETRMNTVGRRKVRGDLLKELANLSEDRQQALRDVLKILDGGLHDEDSKYLESRIEELIHGERRVMANMIKHPVSIGDDDSEDDT